MVRYHYLTAIFNCSYHIQAWLKYLRECTYIVCRLYTQYIMCTLLYIIVQYVYTVCMYLPKTSMALLL